jgi:hypothetical protein
MPVSVPSNHTSGRTTFWPLPQPCEQVGESLPSIPIPRAALPLPYPKRRFPNYLILILISWRNGYLGKISPGAKIENWSGSRKNGDHSNAELPASTDFHYLSIRYGRPRFRRFDRSCVSIFDGKSLRRFPDRNHLRRILQEKGFAIVSARLYFFGITELLVVRKN